MIKTGNNPNLYPKPSHNKRITKFPYGHVSNSPEKYEAWADWVIGTHLILLRFSRILSRITLPVTRAQEFSHLK